MSAEGEYDLVMPFVTVASVGGPHDDESYVAGFEMGVLQARLRAALHHGLGLPEVVIHRENVPQADLIAMDVGARMTEGWPDDHSLDAATVNDWAHCAFEWVAGGTER